jgi:hypothetical protein
MARGVSPPPLCTSDLTARVRASASVAIQGAAGVQFGVIRGLEADRMIVELADANGAG